MFCCYCFLEVNSKLSRNQWLLERLFRSKQGSFRADMQEMTVTKTQTGQHLPYNSNIPGSIQQVPLLRHSTHTFTSQSDKRAVKCMLGARMMHAFPSPPNLLQWYCPMTPHCSYDLASLSPNQNEPELMFVHPDDKKGSDTQFPSNQTRCF